MIWKGLFELKGFCHSDMVGDVDTCKSTSGYVYALVGGAITWFSRLQRIVALYVTEAEYISAVDASEEAIWLTCYSNEFGMPEKALVLGYDRKVPYVWQSMEWFMLAQSILM